VSGTALIRQALTEGLSNRNVCHMCPKRIYEPNPFVLAGSKDSRREFLQKAGIAAGGLALFGLYSPLFGLSSAKVHPVLDESCKPASVPFPSDCSLVPSPPADATPYVFDTSQPIAVRKSVADLSTDPLSCKG
jgi:hypothetical protein